MNIIEFSLTIWDELEGDIITISRDEAGQILAVEGPQRMERAIKSASINLGYEVSDDPHRIVLEGRAAVISVPPLDDLMDSGHEGAEVLICFESELWRYEK